MVVSTAQIDVLVRATPINNGSCYIQSIRFVCRMFFDSVCLSQMVEALQKQHIPDHLYKTYASTEPLKDDEWEHIESDSGFEIHRSGKRYRSVGVVKGVTAQQYAAFHEDLAYRKTWDTNTHTLITLQTPNQHQESVHYSVVSYPFPFSNRDYVYVQGKRCYDEGSTIVYVSRSCTHDAKPAQDTRYVRVDAYEGIVVLRTSENGRDCMLYLEYEEDIKMAIPNWVQQWVFKKVVPKFIANIQRYAREHANTK